MRTTQKQGHVGKSEARSADLHASSLSVEQRP